MIIVFSKQNKKNRVLLRSNDVLFDLHGVDKSVSLLLAAICKTTDMLQMTQSSDEE